MKSIKNKDIIFYPVNDQVAEFIDPPTPSYKMIPDWFKDLPKYGFGHNKFKYIDGQSNLTAKSCLPLVDGFSAGYTFVTHHDIQVSRNSNGSARFDWAFSAPQIDSLIGKRVEIENAAMCPWEDNFFHGYDRLEFNWIPHWCVKTPKGYSAIFTHPINRLDLPFYTLGGIMDTDGWGDAGTQPFLLKSGWEGIIPAGTPYLQVIPFKRENWKSNIRKDMIKEYKKKILSRDTYLRGYYKNNHWKNKNYR